MKTIPRVGFDALFLEHPMTGMGQYALNIWLALRQRDDIDARLLLPADAPASVHELAGDRGVSVVLPGGRRLPAKARKLWWEQSGIVTAAKRAGVDLVHVPYFAAPLRQPVPFVITIHDAIPLVLKDYAGGRAMRTYLGLVSRASQKAHLILTDSVYSAGDIERHLSIPAGRIRSIPLAAGVEFTPASSPEDDAQLAEVRERFDLSASFVLNVGGFDRRKNLSSLVEGFATALPDLPAGTQLVIVGSAHSSNTSLFPPLQPLIDRLGIDDAVRLTGFVSEEDKLSLYRAATVFVFPSLYEGFGLNPLEAMACGTPVISSNRASLAEVVGDGGLTLDPTPQGIASALIKVLDDPALQDDMRRRGLEQAGRFSWQTTAEETVRAYHDVFQSG